MKCILQAKDAASVVIAKSCEGWAVTIVERASVNTRTFLIEAYARSFADGQRVRLGIKMAAEELVSELQ
jgi:hypothetical protein